MHFAILDLHRVWAIDCWIQSMNYDYDISYNDLNIDSFQDVECFCFRVDNFSLIWLHEFFAQ